MPRYVILEHDHPHLHWDFMLEAGDVLRSWRLEQAPQTGMPTRAEALPDHRKTYLDYEGPVSGGRGSVVRWDAGDFEWRGVEHREQQIVVVLNGSRLRGTAILSPASDGWTFEFDD